MFLKYLWKNQRKKAPRPPYHKRGHPDLRKCNITQLKMLSIERPTFFLQGTPVPCQEMIKKKEDEEIETCVWQSCQFGQSWGWEGRRALDLESKFYLVCFFCDKIIMVISKCVQTSEIVTIVATLKTKYNGGKTDNEAKKHLEFKYKNKSRCLKMISVSQKTAKQRKSNI